MNIMRLSCCFGFVIVLLLENACESSKPEPLPKERIEYFANGNIKSRVSLADGKKQGKMTDYFQDGKIRAERWFKDDLQNGRTVFFFPDGRVQEVQYYSAGKRERGDTIWYDNGRLQFTVEMKDDKKNGYLHKWSPDGELVFEARYAMDTLVEVKGEKLPVRRNPGILDTIRVNVPEKQF